MLVEEDKPVAYSEPALAERNVTMSNALTRAAHSLTLAEKRFGWTVCEARLAELYDRLSG